MPCRVPRKFTSPSSPLVLQPHTSLSPSSCQAISLPSPPSFRLGSCHLNLNWFSVPFFPPCYWSCHLHFHSLHYHYNELLFSKDSQTLSPSWWNSLSFPARATTALCPGSCHLLYWHFGPDRLFVWRSVVYLSRPIPHHTSGKTSLALKHILLPKSEWVSLSLLTLLYEVSCKSPDKSQSAAGAGIIWRLTHSEIRHLD